PCTASSPPSRVSSSSPSRARRSCRTSSTSPPSARPATWSRRGWSRGAPSSCPSSKTFSSTSRCRCSAGLALRLEHREHDVGAVVLVELVELDRHVALLGDPRDARPALDGLAPTGDADRVANAVADLGIERAAHERAAAAQVDRPRAPGGAADVDLDLDLDARADAVAAQQELAGALVGEEDVEPRPALGRP